MASSTPYFDLLLTPNRSLDRRHVPWLVGGVALVMGLMALRFLVLGAWPILPFMAVDVALLWWAFRASYRSGRAYEALRLDDEALTVRKVAQSGAERRIRLEPYWTRVQIERLNAQENRLWLASRGQRTAVGQFLSPAEREEIYAVIEDGLARYQRGAPQS